MMKSVDVSMTPLVQACSSMSTMPTALSIAARAPPASARMMGRGLSIRCRLVFHAFTTADPNVEKFVRDNREAQITANTMLKDKYHIVEAQNESTYSCLGDTCPDVSTYHTLNRMNQGMLHEDVLRQTSSSNKKDVESDIPS